MTIHHPSPLQTPLSLRPDSIRQGTLAMTFFAIIALVTNLVLPLFVFYPSGSQARSILRDEQIVPHPDAELVEVEVATSSIPTEGAISSPTSDHPGLRSVLSISWLTLPRAWMASHILTSIILLSTALIHSRISSTFLVGLLGISWALTQWAPYALISAEIARADPYLRFSDTDDDNEQRESGNVEFGSSESKAGTILGVHNMAIATPQIIAAVGSSALFWILGRWDIVDGEAVGWVIRAGGLAGFVAAWLAAGVEDNGKDGAETVSSGP